MSINVRTANGTRYALTAVECPQNGPTVIVARSARGATRRFTRAQLGTARFEAAVSQHIAAQSAARKVQ